MRALLCHAWGTVDDLRLGDVPAPVPAPGEVLIAIIMEKP
jgi:NADPH:quinone reductase-like Zn-dependent oxidoreductase